MRMLLLLLACALAHGEDLQPVKELKVGATSTIQLIQDGEQVYVVVRVDDAGAMALISARVRRGELTAEQASIQRSESVGYTALVMLTRWLERLAAMKPKPKAESETETKP